MGESIVSSIRDYPGVFHQNWLQQKEATGARFDVFDVGLFSAADSVRFGAALVVSDVTGDGDEIHMTTAARSRGGESSKMGVWCLYTRRESVGVLRVTGSLLLLAIACCHAVSC